MSAPATRQDFKTNTFDCLEHVSDRAIALLQARATLYSGMEANYRRELNCKRLTRHQCVKGIDYSRLKSRYFRDMAASLAEIRAELKGKL